MKFNRFIPSDFCTQKENKGETKAKQTFLLFKSKW